MLSQYQSSPADFLLTTVGDPGWHHGRAPVSNHLEEGLFGRMSSVVPFLGKSHWGLEREPRDFWLKLPIEIGVPAIEGQIIQRGTRASLFDEREIFGVTLRDQRIGPFSWHGR